MSEYGPEESEPSRGQPRQRADRETGTSGGRGGRRRRRGGRGTRGKGSPRVSLLALVIFALVFVGAGGYMFLRTYISPPDYSGGGSGSVVVHVGKGASVSAIADTLEGANVVKSSRAFVQAAKGRPKATSIQPGYYRLHRKMAAEPAFELLTDPKSKLQARVTIPEGMRASGIFERIAEHTDISVSQLQRAAHHPDGLSLPSYAEGVEGYLFPATYNIDPDDGATDVLRKMVSRFEQAAAEVNIESRANDLHAGGHEIGPGEVVTVASLVQAEARKSRDFAKVATVIYNRLRRGEKLQLDTTVLYALDKSTLHVSKKDLQVKSPYNTYRHKGLPPGPIESPGEKALWAALHPADGDWLWFITTNPKKGDLKFTSDYQEFLRWKRQFKRNVD